MKNEDLNRAIAEVEALKDRFHAEATADHNHEEAQGAFAVARDLCRGRLDVFQKEETEQVYEEWSAKAEEIDCNQLIEKATQAVDPILVVLNTATTLAHKRGLEVEDLVALVREAYSRGEDLVVNAGGGSA